MCSNRDCNCGETYTVKNFVDYDDQLKKNIYYCTEKCKQCHRMIREYYCQEN